MAMTHLKCCKAKLSISVHQCIDSLHALISSEYIDQKTDVSDADKEMISSEQ